MRIWNLNCLVQNDDATKRSLKSVHRRQPLTSIYIFESLADILWFTYFPLKVSSNHPKCVNCPSYHHRVVSVTHHPLIIGLASTVSSRHYVINTSSSAVQHSHGARRLVKIPFFLDHLWSILVEYAERFLVFRSFSLHGPSMYVWIKNGLKSTYNF